MTVVHPDPNDPGSRHRVSSCVPWLPAQGAVRASVRRATVLVLILLTLTACNTDGGAAVDTQAYRSIWVELYPNSLRQELAEDTLQGSFQRAAAAATVAQAEDRWARFLSAWTPGQGGFEDGMHAHLVTWAELEMKRLQHLKQKDSSATQTVSDQLRRLAAEFE